MESQLSIIREKMITDSEKSKLCVELLLLSISIKKSSKENNITQMLKTKIDILSYHIVLTAEWNYS